MFISLPKIIPILRCRERQDVRTDHEEYNLYFQNIIHPYRESYDVQILCEYGNNFGTFWRINSFPYHVSSFPLTVIVYDDEGSELARKSCTVELYEKDWNTDPFRVLVMAGDSYTHAQKYLEHVAMKMCGIQFDGTRSFNQVIRHEGRGGFATFDYMEKHQGPYGYSPYLFPVGVKAEDYYGDITHETRALNDPLEAPYELTGYQTQPLRDGMIYNRDNRLYYQDHGEEKLFDDDPQWEFSFSKYMRKHQLAKPDAISLKIGGNDFNLLHYDTMEQGIARLCNNIQAMIDSVRKYDAGIPIILHTASLYTSDPYAFGLMFGCKSSVKERRFMVAKYLEQMLERWDDPANGLYICPIHAVIDPINGFRREAFRTGRYYDTLEVHVAEGIHPTLGGYYQLGDALAASIQKIRCGKKGGQLT